MLFPLINTLLQKVNKQYQTFVWRMSDSRPQEWQFLFMAGGGGGGVVRRGENLYSVAGYHVDTNEMQIFPRICGNFVAKLMMHFIWYVDLYEYVPAGNCVLKRMTQLLLTLSPSPTGYPPPPQGPNGGHPGNCYEHLLFFT